MTVVALALAVVGGSLSTLAACRDDSASQHLPLPCPRAELLSGHARSLCAGVHNMTSSPCGSLADSSSMERLIATVGLSEKATLASGVAVYGTQGVSHMLRSEAQADREQSGLGQHPVQLGPAMAFLATRNISSYLELGIATGWTLALMTAYLQRFAPHGPSSFRSTGVDITFDMVSPATRRLLQRLGARLRLRHKAKEEPWEKSPGPIDLCLIDAGHSYDAVLQDYRELAPRCAHILFHDIADFDCWKNANGGPARFWANLKSNLHRSRWVEFVSQPDIFPPTFGLGLVLPHPSRHTAEDDLDWRHHGSEPFGAARLMRRSPFCGAG